MILFFGDSSKHVVAISTNKQLTNEDLQKIEWLLNGAKNINSDSISGYFVGPRDIISPWGTNAVELTQNIGINGIIRIEEFFKVEDKNVKYDHLIQDIYDGLDQKLFSTSSKVAPIVEINDISAYNEEESLALNEDEIEYLNSLSERLGRKLTDSEVFGFSQVNSEHCRHKIFNGSFIIDGEEKPSSLFHLIKETSHKNPNFIVSAYKDNVAFVEGPTISQFAPKTHDKPDYFYEKDIESVISLKAETHNFPTTVEPFNGAATGSGGEVRDRLGGGKGALPLAGTAVYMTSYPRFEGGRSWEKKFEARPWLYQSPQEILTKASNGAADFGNKFGQPVIAGSVLTFEHFENNKKFAFDKVIMMAGGIGFGAKKDSLKDIPEKGDKVIVLGGRNFRIGLGGGAVSSVETGDFADSIVFNAVQRSNPEKQKRAMNTIRAMIEGDYNPIISIHDHGAGGHLNCLSELVESTGGTIHLDKLPIGDPSLSAREIVGNESQERMGMVVKEKDLEMIQKVADRERAPMYVVGETTGDMQLQFVDDKGNAPINWQLADMFGSTPHTVLTDTTSNEKFASLKYDASKIEEYLTQVLQLEAVASKDWITNKIDRSATGLIAKQQTAGEILLPLNNVGVSALDFKGEKGVATSIGHAPAIALIDEVAGSKVAVAESLTNIVWAPLTHGLKGVSLSANWMWPAKNPGENARLYNAVEGLSKFAIELGINVPTGKDSLSMTQNYSNGDEVFSPGAVLVSAAAEVNNIKNVVEPVLAKDVDTKLIYINLSKDNLKLGGSSFAQVINQLGDEAPTINDAKYFADGFTAIQTLINNNLVLAGHDISAGGMITALLEMCFANKEMGLNIDLASFEEKDLVKILFSENPSLILQIKDEAKVASILKENNISYKVLGSPISEREVKISFNETNLSFDIDSLRDDWFRTSYYLDRFQCGEEFAAKRYDNYKKQPLEFKFNSFNGDLSTSSRPKAAVIREKGVSGERELAYAMYLAGFDVKDVHMTDLVEGREDLSDVNFIAFAGGASNSDVFGAAKGWAATFLYNEKAKTALDNFYKREDTMSLGICNGCQLMVELDLLGSDSTLKMAKNDSGKYESAFLNIDIKANESIMFSSLSDYRLGVWLAHGEGKFSIANEDSVSIPSTYSYSEYPGNLNGSDFNAAILSSKDGRHVATMAHIERSIFPWQWPTYPNSDDKVTPWIEVFVNARKWIENNL